MTGFWSCILSKNKRSSRPYLSRNIRYNLNDFTDMLMCPRSWRERADGPDVRTDGRLRLQLVWKTGGAAGSLESPSCNWGLDEYSSFKNMFKRHNLQSCPQCNCFSYSMFQHQIHYQCNLTSNSILYLPPIAMPTTLGGTKSLHNACYKIENEISKN